MLGSQEHESAADAPCNDYSLPRRTCAADRTYRPHDSLENLVKVFISSVETVPVLRQHFRACPVPASREDWKKLPTTNAELYARLTDVREAVREPHRLFSPSAPLDLSRPSFPLTVLQSYEDKLCLDERLEHMLRLAGCQEPEKLTFVVGKDQRYASSDLAELLIYLNHQCSMVLTDGRDQADLTHKVALLGSKFVLWLLPEKPSNLPFPASVSTVITFNQAVRLSPPIRHVDVLHIDVVPYFAASESGKFYSVVSNHFYLESTCEGELLITTLRQDLLPLLRYATGWHVNLKADGFDLLTRCR